MVVSSFSNSEEAILRVCILGGNQEAELKGVAV